MAIFPSDPRGLDFRYSSKLKHNNCRLSQQNLMPHTLCCYNYKPIRLSTNNTLLQYQLLPPTNVHDKKTYRNQILCVQILVIATTCFALQEFWLQWSTLRGSIPIFLRINSVAILLYVNNIIQGNIIATTCFVATKNYHNGSTGRNIHNCNHIVCCISFFICIAKSY